MKKVRKSLAYALLLTMILCLIPACRPAEDPASKKLSIVTTVFPIYDWTREIAGNAENVEITYLLDHSVDMHSYQPTVQGIASIAAADLVIYVGGESDEWMADALSKATNPKQKALNLMEVLGNAALEEEWAEGMAGGPEPGETEYDEHVWLSLRNAELFVQVISKAVQELDPAKKQEFEARTEAYLEKIRALDAKYRAAAESAAAKALVFADRFPFLYLVKDYGIPYYAAFSGCAADSEASFETVAFLAKKIDELGLKTILVIETSDRRLAETVRQTTSKKDQEILMMHSIQSVSAGEVQAGFTYLDAMEENLKTLEKALRTAE
ncbi:MAG: zinc ABC transporter substrate-binding protein [Lachnospiraceae bacterium]|nr:zinc ABC transporter substrate-binding protein [Lachnospiraceae bacterium]